MPKTPSARAELQALQAALAAEHAAVYGYGVAGAMLTGADNAAARGDWESHMTARDTLQAMITKLGAAPAAASAAYRLPFTVHDARSARRLAAALEDGVTRAYLGLVAVTNQTLRTFGALAMQEPAKRAAAWRGSTVAFPGMPAASLSSGLVSSGHVSSGHVGPGPVSSGPVSPDSAGAQARA